MQSKGWTQLEALALDSDQPHQARALELIAAYAFGKPTQPIEASGTLTVEHLDSSTVDQALEYAARRRGLRAVS
jgi:hypothetical protein